MSRSIKIYYGLSGTFKTTTINYNQKPGDTVLFSGIKRWKNWETGLINRLNNPSDLNFALLHFSRLSDVEFNLSKDDTTLHIERGVTDMLFYWLQKKSTNNSESLINNLVDEEISISKISTGGSKTIEKILLIQRDYDFVRDVVLQEQTRSSCFPGGLRDYINTQDRYINFTKKYNNITSEIVITDAKKYLNNLGLEWQNSKIDNEIKN